MLEQLFLDHPRSVGETYPQHARNAFSFGFAMVGAGIACIIHGLLPCLFTRTGSEQVRRLHDRMVVNRA